MNFSVVVLAAGSGIRFGENKQFVELDGKPLWKIVFDTARVVSPDVVVVGVGVPGGPRRRDSVLIGLNTVCFDRVVITEAARPLVTSTQIKDIASVDYPSVSYAIPPVDTVIYNGLVLPRRDCMCLQVPQAFDRDMLIEAHECVPGVVTDDTFLMWQHHGIKPRLLDGFINLFKVTYPGDMDIIRVIHDI